MVTKEIKKSLIANLIKIAKVDNKLTKEEVIFIKSTAISSIGFKLGCIKCRNR
jgi:hypothetical protein